MARYAHGRFSFQLGEVSPSSLGRADSQSYHQMCEEIKNFIARPLGGVIRRPGSELLSGTFGDSDINDLSGTDTVKLIEFNTSYDSQGFLILTPDVIKRYSVNSLAYGGGLSHIGAVSPLGSLLYNTGNNWHVANAGEGYIEGIEQWAQFGDLLVIANGIQQPLFVVGLASGSEKYFLLGEGKLTSLGTLNSGVSDVIKHSFFPFDPINTSTTTMTLSLATAGAGRSCTASAATFTSGMVGMYIRGEDATGQVGLALITGFTSSTVVTVTILQPFVDVSVGADEWALSQWGGSRGWPRSVAFYKGRLVFAGNAYMPDGIWASQIDDLYEFSKVDPTDTVLNSDAFNIRVGQNNSAFVNNLFPKENLFSNMETKEAYLAPIDTTLSIGALNTEVASHSSFGACQSQSYNFMETLTYLGWPDNPLGSYNFARKLLEISFNSEQDRRYDVKDLTKLVPDITRDRCRLASTSTAKPYLRRIAVTKKPVPVIWALDTTGKLYSCARDKDSGTVAWSHHVLGGEYSSDAPKVLDIIPCREQLVMAVVRNTGGNADQICYEILSEEFTGAVLDENAFFLDYAVTGTVSSGEITGLTHLNGNTVHAVVGGEYLGTYTVASNKIVVGTDYNSLTAVVGYNYESLLTPVALDSNALFGTGLGQIKRTEEATILFEKTVAAKVGVVGMEDLEEEIQFRMSTDDADDPIPLFTGEKVVAVPANYERRQSFYVKQDKPFPMNINAIILKGILYD